MRRIGAVKSAHQQRTADTGTGTEEQADHQQAGHQTRPHPPLLFSGFCLRLGRSIGVIVLAVGIVILILIGCLSGTCGPAAGIAPTLGLGLGLGLRLSILFRILVLYFANVTVL